MQGVAMEATPLPVIPQQLDKVKPVFRHMPTMSIFNEALFPLPPRFYANFSSGKVEIIRKMKKMVQQWIKRFWLLMMIKIL
jgi:hypothetical protein